MPEPTLPALVVKVEGTVRETNIDAYRDAALAVVESIKTDLATDEDFAEAEGLVKWCGGAEKKIKEVKAAAMEQAADINAVFTALDEISGALRDKRLALNKQVKAQKDERKREAIDAAMEKLSAHVDALNAELEGFEHAPADAHLDDLEAAAKGKKTLKTLDKALEKAVKEAQKGYAEVHKNAKANLVTLANNEAHALLFADADDHLAKPPAEFDALVKERIAAHEEGEEARLQAEREKIREEERARAEEELEAAKEAAREEARAEAREEVAQEAPREHAGSRDNPHTHHGIDYIELGVADLEAAKAFYSAAFGWRFNDYNDEYAGIVGEGREPGGLREVKEVGEGGPLIVLYSEDLDATLAAVKRAGGEIVEALFEFDGGRQFHLKDPSGNELAVWSDR